MDPDEVADTISGIVSTECKDLSVDEYVEVLQACIGTLQTDIEAAQGG